MAGKLVQILKNPGLLFVSLGHRGMFKNMDDEKYLKIVYRIKMGKKLNLDSPVTFNEKLQWLKLHNRKPEYTQMVDKYEAKKYVAERIGEEYIIPTLGVWDHFEDIDFEKLPNQFVLKCTHDSGGLVICKDKKNFDREAAKKKISSCLKHNFFWGLREWPYKNIKPRIIAEQYMQDGADVGELTDYKFYCFNGMVDCVMACIDRRTGTPRFFYFDKEWNLLRNYNIAGREAPEGFTLPKPPAIQEMFEIAAELSKGFPHIRVDLYSCNGNIYFGELTFFSESGFDKDLTDYLNNHWGNLTDLTMAKNEEC